MTKPNADYTLFKCFIEYTEGVPFDRWALVVADLLHNLRSTLDNAVFELAFRDAGNQIPADSDVVMFPIFDTEPNYLSRGAWRVKGLSEASRTIIEGLQPYRDTTRELNAHGLFILNEIERRNKHRLLQVVSMVPSAAYLGLTGIPPGTAIDTNTNIGLIKDDTPFFVVDTAVSCPCMKVEGKPTLQVGMERTDVEGDKFSLALPLLQLIIRDVQDALTALNGVPPFGSSILGSVGGVGAGGMVIYSSDPGPTP